MKRPFVWHHSCTLHGQYDNPDGTVVPCDPPCEEPWQVDLPRDYYEKRGETFPTQAEAMDWAVEAYENERQWRAS